MKLKTSNPNRHSAFTLIELLVVIAIITLMIALSAAGIFKILIKIDDVKTTREISDLSTGIVNFQQQFGVLPPSRVVLYQKAAYYGPTQVEVDSLTFLEKCFKGITTANSPFMTPATTDSGIIWSPFILGDQTTSPIILEGDQCLVFFLGGIQAASGGTNACVGFSTNRLNPMDTTTDRSQPFFDFRSERLFLLGVKNPPGCPYVRKGNVGNALGQNGFFTYLDAYGKAPFAYFSSYKKANGYNRYYATTAAFSDCDSLGVWPYKDAIKYQNSETFQILCAGRDGLFGPGFDPTSATPLTWTPATADQNVPVYGRDDWANFYDRMLGVPTN